MKRILIVEDDPIGKVVLQKMLETDFQCLVVESAKEALEAVQDGSFDALVLDINLGNDSMDGCDLLARIRSFNGYAEIPAVATTAYAMTGDKEHFLESGFDAYVSKPIRVVELLETVHNVLSQER